MVNHSLGQGQKGLVVKDQGTVNPPGWGIGVIQVEGEAINMSCTCEVVSKDIELICAVALGPEEVQGAFVGVKEEQEVLEHRGKL